MRLLIRFVQGLLLAVLVVIVGAATWLWLAPPELLRVGTGYAAKIVCSNVFIAKRDPMDVLSEDVQAPGHPLLRFLRLDVDRDAGMVTAYMFGALPPAQPLPDRVWVAPTFPMEKSMRLARCICRNRLRLRQPRTQHRTQPLAGWNGCTAHRPGAGGHSCRSGPDRAIDAGHIGDSGWRIAW